MTDILLINLGKGSREKPPLGYDRTTYRFEDGYEVETPLAGLALWKWLIHQGRAPISVRFAATSDAWEGKDEPLRKEIERLGLDTSTLDTWIEVAIPRRIEALWSILPELEDWAGRHHGDGEVPVLHMDLTHAWRAIPISQPWLALFLQRLGLIETGVMGYGAYDKGQTPTPYVDISAVMELAEWAAGVRDFERYGRVGVLRELLGEHGAEWARRVYGTGEAPDAGEALHHLRNLVSAAGAMETFLPAGLPLELGLEVGQRLKASCAEEVGRAMDRLIPGTAPLGRKLHAAASRFALKVPASAKGKKDTRIRLTLEEIERELDLVEYWSSLGAVGEALQALRELIVNRVLLALGFETGWLKETHRKAAQDRLNAVRPGSKTIGFDELPDDVQALGKLWDEVCRTRNSYAHAGMKEDPVKLGEDRDRLQSFIGRFRKLAADEGVWGLDGVLPDGDPSD